MSLIVSFGFEPYFAVIGDIVGSKKTQEREIVQQKLSSALNRINSMYKENIASKFMITLGDEFQGLLRNGNYLMEIIEKIEIEMHPVRIRFGIGVGRIVTDINPDLPLGADGPAYYNARRMIDEIKSSEKKKMEPKTNMKIMIEGNEDISQFINTIFALNTAIKSRWTDRQREVIATYMDNKGTQLEIAQKLSIHQSNVQKALSNSYFYNYQQALDTVTKILANLKK